MSIEETNEVSLPSNPEERKKFMEGVQEIINSLYRIESEREHKKEIVAHLHDQYKIPKKIINKLASTIYKDNFDKVAAEADQFETIYETLVNTSKT